MGFCFFFSFPRYDLQIVGKGFPCSGFDVYRHIDVILQYKAWSGIELNRFVIDRTVQEKDILSLDAVILEDETSEPPAPSPFLLQTCAFCFTRGD